MKLSSLLFQHLCYPLTKWKVSKQSHNDYMFSDEGNDSVD